MPKNSKTEMVISSGSDLSRAVLEARLAAGMTQKDAAYASDLDRTYISRIENEDMSARVERLLDLLRIYGATMTVSFETESE